MTVGGLVAYRSLAELTQSAMAKRLGLGLRAYQDIEALDPKTSLSDRHRLLAERASLTLALEKSSIDLALPNVRKEAIDLVALIRGEDGDVLHLIQVKHKRG